MIKTVNTKNYLYAYHNTSAPYISPGAQSAGMVRFNTNSQCLEIYDGIAWQQYGGSVEIGLSSEVENVIEWAKEKMLEEKRIDELCKKYPGLDKARANYETFLRLVESQTSV
jgi:hypothetical protein